MIETQIKDLYKTTKYFLKTILFKNMGNHQHWQEYQPSGIDTV